MGGQQLERRARVGLGAGAIAPRRNETQPRWTITNACAGIDARGSASREHLLQARVGEVERVRGQQADHEQVERSGHVELLLAAAGGRPARRALDVRRRLAPDSLARARSKARLASTRRSPGVAPGQVGVALEPCRHRRAGLEAALLGVGRAVRLEQQRQLAVLRPRGRRSPSRSPRPRGRRAPTR